MSGFNAGCIFLKANRRIKLDGVYKSAYIQYISNGVGYKFFTFI